MHPHSQLILSICSSFLYFFFFQAEDGIRDLYVTGVQTCALPIYPAECQCGSARAGDRLRAHPVQQLARQDRKSTRLNSSHVEISYAVFCLKKKTSCYSLSFPLLPSQIHFDSFASSSYCALSSTGA